MRQAGTEVAVRACLGPSCFQLSLKVFTVVCVCVCWGQRIYNMHESVLYFCHVRPGVVLMVRTVSGDEACQQTSNSPSGLLTPPLVLERPPQTPCTLSRL